MVRVRLTMRDMFLFTLVTTVGLLAAFFYMYESSFAASVSPAFPGGAITISFDDAWDSQFENALPVLLEHNVPATFYVMTNPVKNGDYGYMNEAQVVALTRLGFEIGAHTKSHLDLTALSDEMLVEELVESKEYLEALTDREMFSLAYPFGATNQTVIDALHTAGYTNGRSAAQAPRLGFSAEGQDVFTFGSFSPNTAVPLERMKRAVDQARERNQWFIFSFHQVGQYGGEYDTPPEDFAEIISYISGSEVPVISIANGVERLTASVEFED